MTLAPGTRFGPYEVVEQIGSGGMGEVWRARDSKLDREVAIKTLAASLAEDKDRLARFEREAKLLASLNHAHIASVYSLDEQDGVLYIAMELVEGENLEQTLRSGPLPVEEALQLALQIALALEAAHEKGVVHRDLKPANVMITPNGVVKVLDFGLAKAFSGNPSEASPAHSPALSLAMTQAGLVLGTAGYMSPEQASGQPADQRADIWSFGVVLYEMLTGLPLFRGESVPHVLAAVLQSEPDWNRLPDKLHPRIRLLLERCLAKKPHSRYHSIADARIDIEQALTDADGVLSSAYVAATEGASLRRQLAIGTVTAVAGLLVGVTAAWMLVPEPPAAPVTRIAQPIGFNTGFNYALVARDGSRVAYLNSARSEIVLRELSEFYARPLPNSAGKAEFISCFSPDGQWLAYRSAENDLRKITIAGGADQRLVPGPGVSNSCGWGDDGYIYFTTMGGHIDRVHQNGGTPETVTALDTVSRETGHLMPQLLPGNRFLLYSILTPAGSGGQDIETVAVQDLETGEQRPVLQGATGFTVYAPSLTDPMVGHLVYGRDDSVFAASFDVGTLTAGPVQHVLSESVPENEGPFSLFASVSHNGTLVYVTGENRPSDWSMPQIVTRDGTTRRLSGEPQVFGDVSVSSDGNRIALSRAWLNRPEMDIVVHDREIDRSAPAVVGAINAYPVWLPNSDSMIYTHAAQRAEPPGLALVDADGASLDIAPASVFEGAFAMPTDVHPGGSLVIGTSAPELGPDSNGDIWMLRLANNASAESSGAGPTIEYLSQTSENERHPTFSPDGNWVAFGSHRSGQSEIVVMPFGRPGPRVQISTDGGSQPRWSPLGNELFYLSGSRLMVVEYRTEPEFRAVAIRELFDDPAIVAPHAIEAWGFNTDGFVYDVLPDAEEFVFLSLYQPEDSDLTELRVVRDWYSELYRQVPLTGF